MGQHTFDILNFRNRFQKKKKQEQKDEKDENTDDENWNSFPS